MSPIGRVFIVLNLLLSALFLGYAAFYLKNHDHYKVMYEQAVADNQKQVAALEDRLSAANTELASTKRDLTTQSTTLNLKERELATAEEENTSNKARLNAFQAKLDSMDAAMSTMSQTIENQNKRNEEATKNWLAAKQERDKAVADRDDFENKLRAAEASLQRANGRNTSLVAELGEKNTDLRKLQTELSVILDTIPEARTIAANALPAVDGTVMNVDLALGTVAISLGKNQAGVEKGWSFAVHDGRSYKGQIRITDVSNNMGYGRIEAAVPGLVIKKGDTASTRLPR